MKVKLTMMIDGAMKKWIIGGVIGVVVLGAGAGVYFGLSGDDSEGLPPTPDMEDPKSLVETLADKRFQNLDKDTRAEYLAKYRETGTREERRELTQNLTEDQQRQLRSNMWADRRQEMQDRIDSYFALPPNSPERTAMLDQMIDGMQARAAEFEQRRREREASGNSTNTGNSSGSGGQQPSSGENRERRGPGGSPGRMKERIESSDPVERAQHMEFFKAMRERMKERGIQMRGPGGPR